MKLTTTALGLVLGSIVAAAPAAAQYATPATQAPEVPETTQQSAAPAREAKVSAGVRKEMADLQKAVNAKDVANIPAKVAAAQAKAKTAEDRYVIAQLQLKAAVDANDNAAGLVALQAAVDSGFLQPAEALPIHMNLAKLHYNAEAYDKAAASLEQVLQTQPNNYEAAILLAETRNSQGRTADAIGLIQKAIAAKTAAGQKAEETWYKRAVALAYNAKMPNAATLGLQWVAAYPNASAWRDTIRIYQTSSRLEDSELIDTMRLAQATGALSGENDYYRFANTLVTKGFAGEAKTVLEQGFAAKSIDRSKASFAQIYALASAKSQGDRASLDASAKTAMAAATARQAMVTAEAYYGYGDYQKAAELFRAALSKQGVDKDVANLRLGMALARAGDKAGAATALSAAGGAQAEVAKLWLTYVGVKA